jgi:uncharacterized protein
MGYVLATFAVFGLVMAGMAVGVIFSRRPLRGSCGGLNALGVRVGETACECGGQADSCHMLAGPSPAAVLRQANRRADGLIDVS